MQALGRVGVGGGLRMEVNWEVRGGEVKMFKQKP